MGLSGETDSKGCGCGRLLPRAPKMVENMSQACLSHLLYTRHLVFSLTNLCMHLTCPTKLIILKPTAASYPPCIFPKAQPRALYQEATC